MLATLIQVRRESKVDPDTKVDQALDNYLLAAMRHIDARIQEIQEQDYEPRRKTKRFDALGFHITDDNRSLNLGNNPLLEVVSIVNGLNQTLTAYDRPTNIGDYFLPGNNSPYLDIQLSRSSNKSWSSFNNEWVEAIGITGIWGYRSRYEEAWVSANDVVQDNPLTSGATSLTVADADGADVFGVTPRFSIGQLLRIESEYLEVTGVNTTTNVLTVRRGVRGTTAVAHVQSTPISLWTPEPAINRAALKWAGYLYFRRGAYEQVKVEGDTRTEFPPDAPEEVQNILDELPHYELWKPV